MRFEYGGPARFEHQKRGLRKILENRGVAALLFDPGLGKTATVLDYCSLLALASPSGEARVLVVAPLAAVDQWALQVSTWVSPQVNVWAEALGGSTQQKVEALAARGGSVTMKPVGGFGRGAGYRGRALHAQRSVAVTARVDGEVLEEERARRGGPDALGNDRPRLVIEALNVDTLSQRQVRGSRTMADVLLQGVQRFNPDLVVVDESHVIKSPSSNVSRLMARIGQRVPRRIILTGTVMPHSPLDVFGQWRFLDPKAFGYTDADGRRRDATFGRFKEDYAVMGGFGGHQVKGFRNLDRMQEIMSERAEVALKGEALDLPAASDVVVPVHLSSAEEAAYKRMKKDLQVTFRSGRTSTAMGRLAQVMRLRQITSGFLPDDEGNVREIGRSRVQTVESIVRDTLAGERRVVVFAVFRREIDALRKALADPATEVEVITGDTPPEERLAIRRRFGSDDPGRIVLIAQIRTLSLAVNELVTACNAVFAGLPAQRDVIVQARDRLNRLGQTRPCTFWYALAPRTVDDALYRAYVQRTDLERGLLEHIFDGDAEVVRQVMLGDA